MRKFYLAIVDQGRKGFGVTFPDFPGCVSAGKTLEEALAGAVEALQGHVNLMIEDGDALPNPSDPQSVPRDNEINEVTRAMVPVIVPGESERVNVLFDRGLLAEIDAAAEAEGLNRSTFLAQAARTRVRALSSNVTKLPVIALQDATSDFEKWTGVKKAATGRRITVKQKRGIAGKPKSTGKTKAVVFHKKSTRERA